MQIGFNAPTAGPPFPGRKDNLWKIVVGGEAWLRYATKKKKTKTRKFSDHFVIPTRCVHPRPNIPTRLPGIPPAAAFWLSGTKTLYGDPPWDLREKRTPALASS